MSCEYVSIRSGVERYTVFRGVLMLVPLLRVLDRLLGSVLG